jgi:hypothetical protein
MPRFVVKMALMDSVSIQRIDNQAKAKVQIKLDPSFFNLNLYFLPNLFTGR